MTGVLIKEGNLGTDTEGRQPGERTIDRNRDRGWNEVFISKDF